LKSDLGHDDDDLALEKLDQFRWELTCLASSADFESSATQRAQRDLIPLEVARQACKAQLASGLARKLSIGMSPSVQQAIEAALELELRPRGNTASSPVTSQPAPLMRDLQTWQLPRTVWDCVELFKQRMRAATVGAECLDSAQEARSEQYLSFVCELETGHPGHQALIYLLRFAHEEEHGLAPGASVCTVEPTPTDPVERSISTFHKLYDRMLLTDSETQAEAEAQAQAEGKAQADAQTVDAALLYRAFTAHGVAMAVSEGMPADVQQAVVAERDAVLASLSDPSDARRAIVLGLLGQAIRQPSVAFAQAVKAAVTLQRAQTQAPVDNLAEAREIYRLFEIQLYGRGHRDLALPMRAQLDKMEERARQQPAINKTIARFDRKLKFNLASHTAIANINALKQGRASSNELLECTYKADVAFSLGLALLRRLQLKGASPIIIHALKDHVNRHLDGLGLPLSVRAAMSLDRSLQKPEFTQVVISIPLPLHR
jgi:hypothetical protein